VCIHGSSQSKLACVLGPVQALDELVELMPTAKQAAYGDLDVDGHSLPYQHLPLVDASWFSCSSNN
jgi:hypothetical protein